MAGDRMSIVKWEPCVPGTDVERVELLQLAARCWDDQHVYSIIEPDRFKILTGYGVLTVIQLAQIFGIGRQAVYVRMLRAGVPLPEHTASGKLNAEYLDMMVVAVKAMRLGKYVPSALIPAIYNAASPKLLEHLTGLPVKGTVAL